LIEVLIVVALFALLSAMVVSGSGALSGTRQRAAATLLMTAIRMGITHANTTGLPTRMVMDLDKHRVMLEESHDRMLRRLDNIEEDPTAGTARADAEAEAQRIVEGPREPLPNFSPLREFGTDPDDNALGRSLGRGIRYTSVQTEHDGEPRTEGKAYLYFWPGGGTEKAVIQLRREGVTEGISLVVSALTGRAQIVRGAVSYEEPDADVDFGEREAE
jgi:general secretion pathway protein H